MPWTGVKKLMFNFTVLERLSCFIYIYIPIPSTTKNYFYYNIYIYIYIYKYTKGVGVNISDDLGWRNHYLHNYYQSPILYQN